MLSDDTPNNKASLPMMPSNTKEKVLQTRMGVIRKTAVTPTTNPTPTVKVKPQPANSDEPEINVDELPVIQGSFQITKTEADITENKKKIEPLTREPPRTSKPTTTKETTTSKATTREAIKQTTPKTKSTTPRNTPSLSTTPRPTKVMPQKTQTEPIVEKTTENIESKNREGVDILADEKQSDLPKLDTLFAVPSYIDQEPWKPIQPGNAYSTANLNNPFDLEVEERLGTAELADDITTTEEDKNVYESPINLRIEHLGDSYSIDNYKPESNLNPYSEYSGAPVYTSFKRPHFSATIKESQNLGERYPVPHPLPVNKLISIPEINDDDGVKPIGPLFSDSNPHPKRNTSYVSTYIPLKDRLSTVSINVKPFTEAESANTEYINLNGGVIVRKQNSSSSVKIQPNVTETIPAKQPNENELINFKPPKINATKEIPSLFPNQMTWELVNDTGKNHSKLRSDPNKSFNETLQAVVTKNDDKTYRPLRNDSKIQNMNNMFKNFSTIFNKLAASLRRPTEVEPAVNLEEKHSETGKEPIESLEEERPLVVNVSPTTKPKENSAPFSVPFIHETRIDNEPTKNLPEKIPNPSSDLDNDDQPLTIHGQGSSEVVVDMTMQELLKETSTRQSTTTVILPTLLPVKSNSGIGRPLRPRPKAPIQADESRAFTNVNPFLSEMKSFINNLQSEDNSQSIDNVTKTNKTSLNYTIDDTNSNKTKSVIRQTTTISPTTSVKTNVVTSISFSNHTLLKNDHNVTDDTEKLNMTGVTNNFQEQIKTEKLFEPIRDYTRKIDISEKFRLPKTHPSEETNISEKIEKAFDNNNKTFVLPTATEFFLTHPSTQAIELAEKVKTIIKGLENSNIRVAPTAPAFVAPIESYKDFQPKNNSVFVNFTQSALFIKTDSLKNNSGNVASEVNNEGVLTDDDILSILKNISLIKTNKNSTSSAGNGSLADTITSDKLKDLANIATITDSHNSSFFGNEKVPDETVISTKAVSSNYAVNSAGFKILTKTFNKIPGNFKDEEKKINKFYNEPAMPTLSENSQSKESSKSFYNILRSDLFTYL